MRKQRCISAVQQISSFCYKDSTIPLLPQPLAIFFKWLNNPVCVGPGRKPRRPLFFATGLIYAYASAIHFRWSLQQKNMQQYRMLSVRGLDQNSSASGLGQEVKRSAFKSRALNLKIVYNIDFDICFLCVCVF